jgi:membrane-bound lytic murein transglycosylase MltF
MKLKNSVLALSLILCLAPAAPASAQFVDAAKEAKARADGEEKQQALALPVIEKPWTGDLDGMIKRRRIRVLVPYNRTMYFLDKGAQKGLAYDAFTMFESELNKSLQKRHVRVHVVFVVVSRDEFIPALLQGKGDVAAATLTITPDRLKQVDFTNPTSRNVSEIVVTAPDSPPIRTLDDLSGREVYLRKSSSFYESLQKVNAAFQKAGKAPVKVRFAPETLETEDILEMVNAGLVQITIADQPLATFWKQIFPSITLHPDVAVRTGTDIGWAIRKNSPRLKKALDDFLARYPEGSRTRNILLQKYLKQTRYARNATSKEGRERFRQVLRFFQEYGKKYDIDFLLMAAQGYQESRLDQSVKSPVGAIGVMQVMPATGKEMNVGDIHNVEPNIHAGVKYVRFMIDQYYADEPMDQLNRGLFAFASYNAGPGRIAQMRKIAAKRGLNPNVWFNNVEIVAAEKIGRETVTYVSNIYKYYLAYQMVMEQLEQRDKALEQIRKGSGKN